MQLLGKIKDVMSIAVPIMVSNLTLLICILINTRVLGNYNKIYFYYLALAMPINYILLAIYEALRTCSLGICQATKLRNYQFILQIKRMMFVGVAIIAVLILFYILAEKLLASIGYIHSSEFYWFIVTMLVSAMCVANSLIVGAALYAFGKQKVATIITVSASIIVCLLNYIFLYATNLGIFSINVAVALVYLGATLVGLQFLKGFLLEDSSLETKAQPFLTIWRFLYSIGTPIFSLYIVIFTSLFIYNTVLQHFGDGVVSAFSVVFRLQNVLMIPAIACGIAVGIVMNRSAMEGDLARAISYLRSTFFCMLSVYLILAILSYIFAKEIIGLLILDLKIKAAAIQCLHYFAFSYVGLAPTLMFISVLEQTGYNKRSLFINSLLFALQIIVGGCLALKFGSQVYFYATALMVNLLPLGYLVYAIFFDSKYQDQPSRLFLLV